jgi:hypothetical protein
MSAESAQKRERESKRKARAARRSERRDSRAEAETPPVDTDALMEQFRLLSERHARGEMDDAAYEAERSAIFTELGVDDPLSG